MNKFIIVLTLVTLASVQSEAGFFGRRSGSLKGNRYQAPSQMSQVATPILASSAQHFEPGVKGYQAPVKRTLAATEQSQESLSFDQAVKGGLAQAPAQQLVAQAPAQASYQESAAPAQVAQAEPLPVQSTYLPAPAVKSISSGVKGTHAAAAPAYQQAAPASSKTIFQESAQSVRSEAPREQMTYQAPALEAPAAAQTTYQEFAAPAQSTIQAEALPTQSAQQAPLAETISYGVKRGQSEPLQQSAAPATKTIYQETAAPAHSIKSDASRGGQATYQAPASEMVSYSSGGTKSGRAAAPIEQSWRKN